MVLSRSEAADPAMATSGAMIGSAADYACFDSMGEVVEVTTTED